ncbi:MAG: flagellar hook-basal body complex protein, partial [Mangrovicoccus sp.]|nr:flagellar hook-basal body complex protein [Mangrovicoccus sp.]
MTISSSLNAGVMGLSANASKLAVISDNIANSGTYGYKRSEADFHSMVTGGASTSYTAGGVRVTSQKLIGDRGSLIATSNSTDIAVRGRGMIPITDYASIKANNGQLPMMLGTTGSFRTDADGYLKSETGLVLMGWPALADGTIPAYSRDTAAGLEPVQIRVNEFAGEPTTSMNLGVNLPATSTEPGAAGDQEVLSLEYYDNLGTSENLAVSFTPSVPSALPASNTWTLQLHDDAQGGALVGEYVLTFNDSRTSGGTLASVSTVSGGAYNPATGEIGVTVASGPLTINIGQLNSNGGITQLSDTFAPVAIT